MCFRAPTGPFLTSHSLQDNVIYLGFYSNAKIDWMPIKKCTVCIRVKVGLFTDCRNIQRVGVWDPKMLMPITFQMVVAVKVRFKKSYVRFAKYVQMQSILRPFELRDHCKVNLMPRELRASLAYSNDKSPFVLHPAANYLSLKCFFCLFQMTF